MLASENWIDRGQLKLIVDVVITNQASRACHIAHKTANKTILNIASKRDFPNGILFTLRLSARSID